MKKDKALDKALARGVPSILSPGWVMIPDEAFATILQALAAPVQEPVAFPDLPLTPYHRSDSAPLWDTYHLHAYALRYASMLTTPPAAQRQWVGLTEDEMLTIEETTICTRDESWLRNLTRNLEAKLKEKNT